MNLVMPASSLLAAPIVAHSPAGRGSGPGLDIRRVARCEKNVPGMSIPASAVRSISGDGQRGRPGKLEETTMRFLMTTSKADPPDDQLVAEMDRLVEEMTRKGVLLAAGGLDPVGTRVTSSGGKITVTDGPFTEAKETILSFALVEARSKDEAIELARRFWLIAGNGEGAIRQVYGPD